MPMCSLSERRLAKAELPSPPHSTVAAELLEGVKQKSDSGRGQAHVLNSSTTAACRILRLILGISESTTTSLSDLRGDHALARALILRWPGSNYPVTLHDCSPGPPPSAASATEASLPVPRSPQASILSRVRPVPGSRPRLSRFAASDMLGLSSWAYAADFGVFKC